MTQVELLDLCLDFESQASAVLRSGSNFLVKCIVETYPIWVVKVELYPIMIDNFDK